MVPGQRRMHCVYCHSQLFIHRAFLSFLSPPLLLHLWHTLDNHGMWCSAVEMTPLGHPTNRSLCVCSRATLHMPSDRSGLVHCSPSGSSSCRGGCLHPLCLPCIPPGRSHSQAQASCCCSGFLRACLGRLDDSSVLSPECRL